MISIMLGGVIKLCQQLSGATRYQISIRACNISVTFLHEKQMFINTKDAVRFVYFDKFVFFCYFLFSLALS